jgi:hypothetical protein
MAKKTTEGTASEETAQSSGIDLSKLTQDDLKRLKALLDETPETTGKMGRTITVRFHDDEYVVGIGQCRSSFVHDPVENKSVGKTVIPVLYFGEEKYKDVDYKDFMQSQRVKCEVLGERKVEDRIVEGIVYSMERKREVEQGLETCVRYYRVRLPNNEEIELFEDAVNL